MNFLLAFTFSILSVIGYSIISIYIGKVAKKFGAFWTSFWIQIPGLFLTMIFIPFFGFHLSWDKSLFPILLFGIGGVFNFILYSKCLSIGPVSVVQSVLRLSNLMTFILAILFLNDSINVYKIIGAVLLIIGVFMVSLDFGQLLHKKIKTLTRALPLTLIQIIISGTIYLFLGIAIKHFGGFSANVGVRLAQAPLFLLLSVTQRKPDQGLFRSAWKVLLFITFIDVISFILYTRSVQLYQVSLASMIQTTIPVFTAVFGALFFHEYLNSIQKLGIFITVVGSMSLAISG